jgi:hypothetical protein
LNFDIKLQEPNTATLTSSNPHLHRVFSRIVGKPTKQEIEVIAETLKSLNVKNGEVVEINKTNEAEQ